MNNYKNCLSEDIKILTTNEIVKYKGHDIPFLIEYSVCNNCNHEFVSKQQIHDGDCHLRDAKKAIDGLLTSQQIKQARKQLGLTQEQAALVFGGGKNAFSKYERAEVSQSVAMDTLIRVYLDNPKVYKNRLIKVGLVDAFIQVGKQSIAYPKPHNPVKLRLVKSIPPTREKKYG